MLFRSVGKEEADSYIIDLANARGKSDTLTVGSGPGTFLFIAGINVLEAGSCVGPSAIGKASLPRSRSTLRECSGIRFH